MKITQLQPQLAAPMRPAAQDPAPPSPAPPEPPTPENNDSFVRAGGREAMRNAVRWGNATSTVLGGAGALAMATGSLYAGVLGGAVIGSAMGLGAGPVVASLSSSGAWNFLGTTFGTAGFAAKAGMVVGGAAMAAGAWGLGSSLGSAVGKPVGALLGAPVGFAQGVWSKMEGAEAPAPEKKSPKKQPEPLDLNRMTGATKAMAMGIGGLGLLAGGTGGALLGASVTSAHSLVQGLLAHNVSLTAMGGAALAGAAIGGAAGAFIGGKGGFEVAKKLEKVGGWVGDKLIRKDGGSPSAAAAPTSSAQPGAPAAETAKNAGNDVLQFTTKLSAAQVGLNVADAGMGLAESFSSNPWMQPLGYGMAGIHGVRCVGHLLGSVDQTGMTLQHRLSTAAGEALLGGGHLVAAAGGGGWSLLLLGAGMALNTVSDYRYSAVHGV